MMLLAKLDKLGSAGQPPKGVERCAWSQSAQYQEMILRQCFFLVSEGMLSTWHWCEDAEGKATYLKCLLCAAGCSSCLMAQ